MAAGIKAKALGRILKCVIKGPRGHRFLNKIEKGASRPKKDVRGSTVNSVKGARKTNACVLESETWAARRELNDAQHTIWAPTGTVSGRSHCIVMDEDPARYNTKHGYDITNFLSASTGDTALTTRQACPIELIILNSTDKS